MEWLKEGSLGPVFYASPLMEIEIHADASGNPWNLTVVSILLNFYLFDLTTTSVVVASCWQRSYMA